MLQRILLNIPFCTCIRPSLPSPRYIHSKFSISWFDTLSAFPVDGLRMCACTTKIFRFFSSLPGEVYTLNRGTTYFDIIFGLFHFIFALIDALHIDICERLLSTKNAFNFRIQNVTTRSGSRGCTIN